MASRSCCCLSSTVGTRWRGYRGRCYRYSSPTTPSRRTWRTRSGRIHRLTIHRLTRHRLTRHLSDRGVSRRRSKRQDITIEYTTNTEAKKGENQSRLRTAREYITANPRVGRVIIKRNTIEYTTNTKGKKGENPSRLRTVREYITANPRVGRVIIKRRRDPLTLYLSISNPRALPDLHTGGTHQAKSTATAEGGTSGTDVSRKPLTIGTTKGRLLTTNVKRERSSIYVKRTRKGFKPNQRNHRIRPRNQGDQ